MASAKQVVNAVLVYDYVYQAGDPTSTTLAPATGVPILITLQQNNQSSASPVVQVMPTTISTKTDSNGYWQAELMPNNKQNPSGSVYAVQVGGMAPYQINVTDVAVPAAGWQSSALVVNTPAGIGVSGYILAPGTSAAGSFRMAGPDPWYDVTHPTYGAKGDGVADDTAAIQAALNAANTAGSGTVYLPTPTGAYSVTSSLTVYSNTNVIGSGWAAVVNMTGAWTGTSGCFVVNAAAVNVTFEDFKINCLKASKAGTTASRGIFIPNATTVRVNRVFIQDPGTGGVDVAAGADVGVTNCRIQGGGDGTNAARSHSIGFAGNTAPSLVDCFAIGNTIIGPYDTGIGLFTGVTGVTVMGNILRANGLGSHGIDCPGANRCSIVGNTIYVDTNATDGIFLHPQLNVLPSTDMLVSGNTIIGTGLPGTPHGINVQGTVSQVCDRHVISGNSIRAVGGDGIYFGGVNGTPSESFCSITGNVITGCLGDGIQMNQGGGANVMTSNVVEGNVCANNTGYGINFQNNAQTGNRIQGNMLSGNTAGPYNVVAGTNQPINGTAWGKKTDVYAANAAADCNVGDVYAMATLTGPVSVLNAFNPIQGARMRYYWTQDATGGRVVTYTGTNFRLGGATAFVTTASTVTIDDFECIDGTIWRLVSRITGQAI